jgi:hypothetical protein
MKKIITPAVREESEIVCDVTGKPAMAGLLVWFCDGSVLKVDLSNEVAEDILKMLQDRYPQFQIQEREGAGWTTSVKCPLCEGCA